MLLSRAPEQTRVGLGRIPTTEPLARGLPAPEGPWTGGRVTCEENETTQRIFNGAIGLQRPSPPAAASLFPPTPT